MGNSPAADATKSMVTGVPPRGTVFSTRNFLMPTPCTPSADVTTRRMCSPSVDLDAGRLEGESPGHHLDHSWVALSEGSNG